VSRCASNKLLYLEGERFISERTVIIELLCPGMSVVDIGANIGYYLLMFEKGIHQQGRIICIEPSEENLPELRRNISANHFSNVRLHEVAIGMEDGTTGLRSGINSGIVESGKGTYEVQVKRLDSLVSEKIDFIKIDVEGYEGQVIRGACGVIMRDRPTLFVEFHPHILPRFGFTLKGIVDELSRHYSRKTFFEPISTDPGIVKKVSSRYFNRHEVRKIDDMDSYIEKYNAGNKIHSFWAVFRNA
jgi:FkbM family methyltransferase